MSFAFAGMIELLLAVAVIMLAGPQKVGAPKTTAGRSDGAIESASVSVVESASIGEGSRPVRRRSSINDFLDYREGGFALSFFGNAVLHWAVRSRPFRRSECAPPEWIPRPRAVQQFRRDLHR